MRCSAYAYGRRFQLDTKKPGLIAPAFLLSVLLWPETKKGSAFPQTLISFLVELRRIELLTS